MIRTLIFLLGAALAIGSASANRVATGDLAPPAQQKPATPAAAADEEARARAYFTDRPLLTHEGKAVRFYTDVLKDRVVLINFIYTNCKDACPLMTQMLNKVRDSLGERFDNPVRFVSISTDPARDTPQALKKFATQQKADDPGWFFLTGEKQHVDFIIKRLGQYSPNVEAHSTLMLAGNVRTRHWIKIRPMTPPAAIVAKLEALAAES